MTIVDQRHDEVLDCVGIDTVRRKPSFTAAVFLGLELANITDQRLSLELEIDPATLSKIRNGSRFFPPDKIVRVMELCGNVVPLMWLADHCGYGLVRLQSEVERENLSLKAEMRELKNKLAVVTEFLGKAGDK